MMKKGAVKKAPAAKKQRVSPKAHQLPEPIRAGEILTDTLKKQWQIGTSIGTGGFGEIYRASDDVSRPVAENAEYVVKIEPHSNGPLFSEMHFYIKAAKPDLISEWMKKNGLRTLGMPRFIGNGSHEYDGNKYRFMVMERFGVDLQKLFEARGKRFSVKTVLTLGIKILDILEYIHQTGYIHADIKGSNLLLGPKPTNRDQVYLVDYGLACRYLNGSGVHKEYKPDPKRAHDGTIEFTSRDAHIGATARRGDLEILGYNMVQWLVGSLPWEDKLKDQGYVHKQKERFMSDIPLFMRTSFKTKEHPEAIERYLEYVAEMDFTDLPDYELCRKLFHAGLKRAGSAYDGKLGIDKAPAVSPKPTAKSRKKTVSSGDEPENEVDVKPAKVSRSTSRQPCRPAHTNRSGKSSGPVLSDADLRKELKLSPGAKLTPAMEELLQKRALKHAAGSFTKPAPKKAKIDSTTPTKPIRGNVRGRPKTRTPVVSPVSHNSDYSPELF